MEGLKIGEYHLNDDLGYPPVLAGEYFWSNDVFRLMHVSKNIQ